MEVLDIASLIGIIAGIVLIIYGIISGDAGVAAINDFLDPQSAIITFGGTFTAVLTSYTLKDYIDF